MPPLVRAADLADSGAIASAHARSWQVGYAGLISGDFLRRLDLELPQRTMRWQTLLLGAEAEGRFVLVGEVDGEVAGWLSGGGYRDAGPEESALGEVYGCYVDPAHWREGVGSALMTAALERLARAGYAEAALWVLQENSRARAFYERHGWFADGGRKLFEVAGGRYPEIRYRRLLQ
jgi:ribosomal protein S18 acetylase RimI-like enzyme